MAAGLDADALSFRDARERNWEKGLRSAAFVITDSLMAPRIPAGCEVKVFRVFADASLKEIREYGENDSFKDTDSGFVKSCLSFFRERADVIHHVPAFFLVHASLTRGHDPGDTFRDLPEELAVSHLGHAFLIRDDPPAFDAAARGSLRFLRQFAVTEDAVAFGSFDVELFCLLRSTQAMWRSGFFVLSASSGSSHVFCEKSCCCPAPPAD